MQESAPQAVAGLAVDCHDRCKLCRNKRATYDQTRFWGPAWNIIVCNYAMFMKIQGDGNVTQRISARIFGWPQQYRFYQQEHRHQQGQQELSNWPVQRGMEMIH